MMVIIFSVKLPKSLYNAKIKKGFLLKVFLFQLVIFV
jgi:hypothetical protein